MANKTDTKTPPVVLSDELRSFLELEVRHQSITQGKATCYRVMLRCVDGLSNMEVVRRVGVSFPAVGRWRWRSLEIRVKGLSDMPRLGRLPIYSQDDVEEVASKTIRERPANATHWSLDMTPGEADMSHTAVWRTWGEFNLKPHRTRSFNLTEVEKAVDKIRAIFELYRNSPKNTIVFSFDEITGIQVINRTTRVLGLRSGYPEQRIHYYKRNGRTDQLAARNIVTGHVLARCYERHRAVEFLEFLIDLEKHLPVEVDIFLILDNSIAQTTTDIKKWFAARPLWHVVVNPKLVLLINQIERWLAEISRRVLRCGDFRSVAELVKAIYASLTITTGILFPASGVNRQTGCWHLLSVTTSRWYSSIGTKLVIHHTKNR